MMCIPNFDRCGVSHDGHWCDREPGHPGPDAGDHQCECGHAWPVDLVAELAELAYVEIYSVRYLDAPDIPPLAVVKAGSAPGTPIWRAITAVLAHLGLEAA